MKAVSNQARRSRFYHQMIWPLPVRRTSKTETARDTLGVVLVIGLVAGIMVLMRFLLSH